MAKPSTLNEMMAALDAEAQVTPQDFAAAQEFWSHLGTPLLRALLNATAESDGPRRGREAIAARDSRG